MPPRKRLQAAETRPAPTRVEIRRAHPLAWAKALELVDGDVRRLQVEPDGSVLVR